MKHKLQFLVAKKRMLGLGVLISISVLLVGLINLYGYISIKESQSSQLMLLRHSSWQYEQISQSIALWGRLLPELEGIDHTMIPSADSSIPKGIQANYDLLSRYLDSLIQDSSLSQQLVEKLAAFQSELSAFSATSLGYGDAAADQSSMDPPAISDLIDIQIVIAAEYARLHDQVESFLSHMTVWFLTGSSFCVIVSVALSLIFILLIWKQEEGIFSAQRASEKANLANSDLLAHISQEFRIPLNGVTSSVDLLRNTDLSTYQKESLEVLESSMESIVAMIADVLDVAEIESSGLLFDPEAISLNEFLESLHRSVNPLAYAKNMILVVYWERGDEIRIEADPLRLRQVLHNIISRVIKSNSQGSIDVYVETTGYTEDSVSLKFSVTGLESGMSPKEEALMKKIFANPAPSLANKPKFMDLGLFVSMAVVDSLGSTLELNTEAGKGTTYSFSMELPLIYSARQSSSIQRHQAQTTLKPKAAPKALTSVLIVDDIAVNRLIAKRLLEKLGIRAEQADSAAEAINILQAKHFDLVLMDLKMPDMDGWEATRIIRSLDLERQPVIIALTAYVLDFSKTASTQAGLDDFLSKPLRLESLQECVEKYFDLNAKVKSAIRLQKNS